LHSNINIKIYKPIKNRYYRLKVPMCCKMVLIIRLYKRRYCIKIIFINSFILRTNKIFIWPTIRIKIFHGEIIFAYSIGSFDFEGALVRKPQVPEL